MKIITATEFRKEMAYYLDLATKERVFISHRGSMGYELVPEDRIQDDGRYFTNQAVIDNINQSELQIKEGRAQVLTSSDFDKQFCQ